MLYEIWFDCNGDTDISPCDRISTVKHGIKDILKLILKSQKGALAEADVRDFWLHYCQLTQQVSSCSSLLFSSFNPIS